jgi:hypothetical protein
LIAALGRSGSGRARFNVVRDKADPFIQPSSHPAIQPSSKIENRIESQVPKIIVRLSIVLICKKSGEKNGRSASLKSGLEERAKNYLLQRISPSRIQYL